MLRASKLFLALATFIVFTCATVAPTYADGIFFENTAVGNNTFATGQDVGTLINTIQIEGTRAVAAEVGGQASFDFYRFLATAGQILQITVNVPQGACFTRDPTVALHNPAGTQVAFNDDVSFPTNCNSFIQNFSVTTTGIWAINVDGFAGNAGWPYTAVIHNTGAAPVPEPATMLLLGSGLAGAVGALRKRRKSIS